MKTVKFLAAFLFVVSVAVAKPAPTPLKVDTQASTFNWLAKKFGGQHNGTINIQSGTILIDKNKLVGGEFAIEMASLKDLDAQGGMVQRLENHLKSDDFFNAEKFPTSTLKITKVVPKGGENVEISGDLTIKGVTQAITFPATVKLSPTGLTAAAKFMVDRTKFGLKYRPKTFFAEIGDKMIDDEFEVDVKIVANK